MVMRVLLFAHKIAEPDLAQHGGEGFHGGRREFQLHKVALCLLHNRCRHYTCDESFLAGSLCCCVRLIDTNVGIVKRYQVHVGFLSRHTTYNMIPHDKNIK